MLCKLASHSCTTPTAAALDVDAASVRRLDQVKMWRNVPIHAAYKQR
jgi:hypothetical protein